MSKMNATFVLLVRGLGISL
ncbi:hypothetical protein JL09_g5845 [Pichia kudriavzevii]|uniref:Uncharacterized protein n=1 Tax=Pichia kudriavzevii TaxID=4909 RepID=A0A099NT10_PICKU|nr:hypothetical protein JL09_g5845 [Pichia kudriavzevii]